MKSKSQHPLPVPFPRSYWVIPGLVLAGEYPGAQDPFEAECKLSRLAEAGIRRIINLMESDELDYSGKPFYDYEELLAGFVAGQGGELSVQRFAVRDMDIPEPAIMMQILDVIDDALARREPVYVHCWGGVGRTGTVVGCFLMRRGLARENDVIDLIRQLRANDPAVDLLNSPQTQEQVEFVRSWTDHEATSQ